MIVSITIGAWQLGVGRGVERGRVNGGRGEERGCGWSGVRSWGGEWQGWRGAGVERPRWIANGLGKGCRLGRRGEGRAEGAVGGRTHVAAPCHHVHPQRAGRSGGVLQTRPDLRLERVLGFLLVKHVDCNRHATIIMYNYTVVLAYT